MNEFETDMKQIRPPPKKRAAAAVDVEADLRRMVATRRDPEATHAYARALVILDWGWRRQQQLAEARRRRAREVRGCVVMDVVMVGVLVYCACLRSDSHDHC